MTEAASQHHQVDNLDSMKVGWSSEENDADDDIAANALAAGSAAGLADVVAAGKKSRAPDDSESNESRVTRDNAELMPNDDRVPEYGDLTGFDSGHDKSNKKNRKGRDDDSSSSSSSSSDSESDKANANTSESLNDQDNRKGGRRGRKGRGNKKSGPNMATAPAPPEVSSDKGAHRYGVRGVHHEDSMEPRLPPAPEPALHEYGAVGAASASGAAAAAARASVRPSAPAHSSASVCKRACPPRRPPRRTRCEVRMPMYHNLAVANFASAVDPGSIGDGALGTSLSERGICQIFC